ncbi:MAG: GntR family transcriptional regulator [Nocardioidaceae bacterium]|nr:GntR family transcriptional regulator [Nocardioidaceae bacterium]
MTASDDLSWVAVDATRADPPPYDQVKRAIAHRVSDGRLAPGTKLPTVRALAATLGVAANTVARAYRELEAAGVVDTRGRAGTFVSGDDASRAAREAAAEFAGRARALGLSRDDAVALVDHALRIAAQGS